MSAIRNHNNSDLDEVPVSSPETMEMGLNTTKSKISKHHVMEHRLGEEDASKRYLMSISKGNSSMSDSPGAAKDHPLTVFARHKIKRGKEDLFEAWVKEISQLQYDKYEGFGGVQVVRPTCCESNEYVSIFRYDNYEKLQTFMNSEDRQAMLSKTVEFEEAPIEISYHSLEFWFVQGNEEPKAKSAAGGPPRPPSKPKMILITFLLIWAQITVLGPPISRIPGLPRQAATALTVFVLVFCTTYIWMPIATQYIFFWFLFPGAPGGPCADFNRLFLRFRSGSETAGNKLEEETDRTAETLQQEPAILVAVDVDPSTDDAAILKV